MKITEKELKKLGFEKQVVSAKQSGCENGFYYFTYDILGVSLISDANDENKGDFSIEFFEGNSKQPQITDLELLTDLIEVLDRVKELDEV